MVNVYLKNKTGRPVFVIGSKGTDWGDSLSRSGFDPNISNQAAMMKDSTSGQNKVEPDECVYVATMTDPTSGSSDHWGWIFIGLHGPKKPVLQLYVAAGTSRGLFDYAVQWYDGGKNRNGDTIAQTEVEKTKDGVIFTISHVFDPWTSQIPDGRMLHQITIPGTHDSGTRGLLSPSECQDTTIEDQLIMGVRYFDIRVDSSTGSLRVVHGGAHGSGNTDLYFNDVARIFRDFLTGERGFPSKKETVIVQVKSDRGGESGMHAEVVNKLKGAFSGAEDRLYLKPIRLNFGAVPTIGDLRGKLILMRRYDYVHEDDQEAATPVKYFVSGSSYNTWSNSPNHQSWPNMFKANHFVWPNAGDNIAHFGGSLTDYRNRHGLSFVIQDKYEDYGSYQDKFDLVKTYLDKASQGGSPDSWFLNFSSCTSPVDSAKAINPHLAAYFKNPPSPRSGCGFGTILMDFVEPDLVRSIIAANF